jgi:hypothetical protein
MPDCAYSLDGERALFGGTLIDAASGPWIIRYGPQLLGLRF